MSTAASAVVLRRAPRAAPARLSVRRLCAINAFWFGNGAHWQPLFVALVPEGAKLLVGSDRSDALVGRATAAGGIFALLVPLLAGWLSDRTRSRFGRRRPWMVAGSALNIVGLLLLGLAWSPVTLIGFYLLVQAGNNIAGAAYSGVIPDAVPAPQRGTASGLLGTMNQLGTVVGILLIAIVFSVFGRNRSALLVGYGVVAAIFLTTLVITCIATRERPLEAAPRARLRFAPRATAFGISLAITVVLLVAAIGVELGSALGPVAVAACVAAIVTTFIGKGIPGLRQFFAALGDHDFRWVFLTRMVMQIGIFSIVPFIDSYFEKVVGSTNSGAASSYWLLAVIAGGIVPAVWGGRLSDRAGRRKPFVYVAGALQALAASVILVSLVSSPLALYGIGLVFGVGYGAYYAIDWALACDVLPDREQGAGRDMAIWHISFTLPQVIAPTIAAVLLTTLNNGGHSILGISSGNNLGFRVVFGSAAIWFTLGTVLVSRVRGVR
ncbi:MAG TPA: MFS transporter [Candidatus Dormibacteraeota bacterium]